ncbi:MAG: hypothetical protein PHV06_10225 [bacterium]|nr:hypothetical protein [bacterium]
MRNNSIEKGAELKNSFKLFIILIGLFLIVFVYAHMHIKTLNLGYKYILLQNKKLALQTKNFQLKKDLGRIANLEKIDELSSEKLDLTYPDSRNIYVLRIPKTITPENEKDFQGNVKVAFQSLLRK